jgi:predicted DNA-binding transcriptional regulator AlpA
MNDERLLRVGEVAKKLAVSTREIWRGVAEGIIPSPIKLGAKTTRWFESDISSFLEQRKSERSAK